MIKKIQKQPGLSKSYKHPVSIPLLLLITFVVFGSSYSLQGNDLCIHPEDIGIVTNESPILLFPLDTNFTEDSQLLLSHATILDAVYDPDHADSLLTITITADSGLVFYWYDQASSSHKFWANKDIDSCGYFHIRVQDPLDSVLIQSFIVDIIPVNDAPIINAIPDTSTIQDSTFYMTLDNYWSDVDNESSEMTWSIRANYSNVSITGTKDSLICIPPPGFIGWDTLFLSLTDIDGLADRDTFRLYFRDAHPPGFTVGVFQNPVASEHLDIYFFPNESIDSLYSAVINSDSISSELLTSLEPAPYHIHYRLENSGVQQLRITASDTSGNVGTTEYDFSSAFISKLNGGVIYSPDSAVQLIIASGSQLADNYLLCLPYNNNYPAGQTDSEYRLMKETDDKSKHHYTFVAPRTDLSNKCKLIFYQISDERQLGIFEQKQQNWVYRKTYSNATNSHFWTYLDKLGTFALRPNAPVIAEQLPVQFSLAQNYPNPFNSETVISFKLPELPGASVDATARITVYDILGRKVETIFNQALTPGQYSFRWTGSQLASGAYYYTIQYGQFIKTKKMVLLK